MPSRQTYELSTLTTLSSPINAPTHNGHFPRRSDFMVMPGPFPGARFFPGLLSRSVPVPDTSIWHKLNSVYVAVGMALTLLMKFMAYRLSVLSWKLSQWTAQKDFYEWCLELKQVDLKLPEQCIQSMVKGLAEPPLSKRWLNGYKAIAGALGHLSFIQPETTVGRKIGCSGDANVYRHCSPARDGIRKQGDDTIMYGGLSNYTDSWQAVVPNLNSSSRKGASPLLETALKLFLGTLLIWVLVAAGKHLERRQQQHRQQDDSSSDVQVSSNLSLFKLWRIFKRSHWHRPAEVDLYSGMAASNSVYWPDNVPTAVANQICIAEIPSHAIFDDIRFCLDSVANHIVKGLCYLLSPPDLTTKEGDDESPGLDGPNTGDGLRDDNQKVLTAASQKHLKSRVVQRREQHANQTKAKRA